MTGFLVNVVLTGILVSIAVELGKRSPAAASILISIPLSSVIGLSLLYVGTRDTQKVASMSTGIFWALLPSLILVLLLPFLLRRGWTYWPALSASCAATVMGYGVYAAVLKRFGVAL